MQGAGRVLGRGRAGICQGLERDLERIRKGIGRGLGQGWGAGLVGIGKDWEGMWIILDDSWQDWKGRDLGWDRG